VNYSRPLHHVNEGDCVDEVKGEPRTALAASPLLFLLSPDQCCVFCVSQPPHHKIARGVLYIVGFRSRRICGVQDCIERTHKRKSGPHHPVSLQARVVCPNSRLIASPVDFFFSRSSISRQNDMTKRLGPFDVCKVPESQKHAKKQICFRSVKTKWKGII
jgi:hypothetical protein